MHPVLAVSCLAERPPAHGAQVARHGTPTPWQVLVGGGAGGRVSLPARGADLALGLAGP